jgi:serine/threonine protein phosphatase PrpC
VRGSSYDYTCTLASGRRNSEDRAEVFHRGSDLVVVVADGAGGMRGGARASAALIENVRSVAADHSLNVHDDGLWSGLLMEADAALAARRVGETTGVVVVVGTGGVTGVSVGDSEAWVVSAKSVDDLTRHQERPRLGSGRATPVVFHRAGVGGVLLVATDGLFRYASPERISATVRACEASRVAQRLTKLVQMPSGAYQDDVGIVVVARHQSRRDISARWMWSPA